MTIDVVVVGWLAFGVVGELIGAAHRRRGGFLLSLLLGPIGWLLMATKTPVGPLVLPSDLRVAPEVTTPAWHPDPFGRYHGRWWDGVQWTDRVVTEPIGGPTVTVLSDPV